MRTHARVHVFFTCLYALCKDVCTHTCIARNREEYMHSVRNREELCVVLEIRSKWWMDKCPSIIILHQTISDLLRQIFGCTFK